MANKYSDNFFAWAHDFNKDGWNDVLIILVVVILGSFALGHLSAAVVQGKMEVALAQLKQARVALEAANNQKGGHRQKAITYTDMAIAEVEKGIRFAETNR